MNGSRSERTRAAQRKPRDRSRTRRSSRSLPALADRLDDAYRSLGTTIAAVPPKDLTRGELVVLEHVADGEGATLGWLAEQLGLPKSTASVLVKDLERRRFVRRRRRDDDERRLEVTLTPKGRRRVSAARALDHAALTRALAALPRTDRLALVDATERLTIAARARTSRSSRSGPNDA